MDWPTPLRKLVNLEGHLGPARLALLRLIDPIEWYMRKNDPEENPRLSHRRRARGAVGWTTYGPSAPALTQRVEAPPGSARPERRPEDAERRIEEYWKRRDAMRREHAALFEAKARELLTGKQAIIETTAGTVRARLVRFRNGAVFEQWRTSRRESGHGMVRFERRHLSDPVALIVDSLAQTVVEMGPDARPLG